MGIVIKGINFLRVVEGKCTQYTLADLGPSGQPTPPFKYLKDRQCTYNVTLRCVHVNIVAVGKK
jgi:hypothetical protein